MITANLVVKEVFVDVQRESEQWEQTSSQRNRRMAVVETNQTKKQEQGDGGQILISHHFVSEAGRSFRPDVLPV
jgi:hypothetical protein